MRYISGIDESIQSFSAPTLTRLTTTGTFTPATTTKRIYVICQGAGGGGGGGGASYGGYGGGGGGCWMGWVDVSPSISYVVGTGGSGGALNLPGSAGTETYFVDTTHRGLGGAGGQPGLSLSVEAAAGGAYSAATNGTGMYGGYGGIGHDTSTTRYGAAGGSSYIGGGGGGCYGVPPFNASRYGQGGCGGSRYDTTTGANGANGVIYVYEYSY